MRHQCERGICLLRQALLTIVMYHSKGLNQPNLSHMLFHPLQALEARALQSLARRREQAQNTTGGPVSLGARVRASSSPGRRPPLTALGRTAAAVKRPVLTQPRR